MISVTRRQFLGVPFPGILHQKPQRVDAPERGISFSRPERFVVNTPNGQVEICQGDWVLELPSGARYVVKNNDIEAVSATGARKWWQLW